MRKLFFLIPALVLSLITANAATHEIGSGTSNILGSTVASAADGDVIVLTDNGPYVNVKGDDDYTKLEKNLTIQAAEGKNPVVQYEVPFRSTGGKTVKFIGITFDGTSLTGYDWYFRFYDANDNLEFEDCEFRNISKYVFDVYTGKSANSLKLTNCRLHDISSRGILNRGILTNLEINGGQIYNFTGYPVLDNYDNATLGKVKINGTEFYNNAKDIISGVATSHADSCIINNCYFHNNSRSAVYFVASSVSGVETCDGVIVKNSTFANNDLSASSRSVIEVQNYGAAEASNIEVTVDHCTFYNNTTVNYDYSCVRSRKSTKVYITNSIFAYPSAIEFYATNCYGGTISNTLVYNLSRGHRQSGGNPAVNNTITDAPAFTDAANGDFSFDNDWVNMNISPICGAATDGTDLGDPRWYTAPVLPSTNFAGGYQFAGAKAQISGNLWYDGTLYYNDKSENGVATWKINATRACILAATLNMNAATTTGHKFKVQVLDADGNSIGETAEPSQIADAGNIALPDQFILPAAGIYTVKLYNLTSWSSAKIDGVTLSYVGGDVQVMPGTTAIADAWFSAGGTREDGKIDFPDGYIQEGWVKWNVSFANAANYNVTVNIDNANGHNYTVALYRSESDESPIVLSEGSQKSTIGTLELGAMEVPAGNYIMKVTNATQYSDAKLISVNFAYAGGAAIDLSKTTPASLLPNADAILSDDWTIAEGKISYAESKATTGYAKWNVNCANYANYNVTVNISSDNGHGMRVEVFEDETQPAIYTLDEPSSGKYHTGDLALDLGNIVLADREYVVKITNTVSSSHAQIASIVITYMNGAQATLPATFNFEDGMLSEKAHVTAGELWFNTIGDSNPVGQWAKWNVKVAEAGTFLFTANVNSSNGQSYKISILDINENELDAFESGSLGSGDKTIKHYFNLAAGNYIVKLENTYAWSQGHIVSLVVTQPEILVLDETVTDNSVIVANYRIDAQDIQISRTIVPGMYNTICLPFDVSTSQLQAIFGSDVELIQMQSATLNGDELILNFENVVSGGINRGTPYLIRTSKAVVNPVFTDAVIKEKVAQATGGEGFDVDFIGSFIKTTIDGDPNNLYLEAHNTLNFSDNAVTMKGMRAYFHVKGAATAAKRARIVTRENTTTAIDLQNGENKAIKCIENGQVVILRDGQKYNVMGIKLQ